MSVAAIVPIVPGVVRARCSGGRAAQKTAPFVHLDPPGHIVGRDDVEDTRAGESRGRRELGQWVPVGPPDAGPAEQLAGEELQVPLLRADEVLKRPVERAVRAAGAHLELRGIEVCAELQKGHRRPGVVAQHLIERLGAHYVCSSGLPRLRNLPRPFFPTNFPPVTITAPRDRTVVARPFTRRPSYGL